MQVYSAFAASLRSLYRKRVKQQKICMEGKHASDAKGLYQLLKNRDILLTQAAVLNAMTLAAEKTGSRGSCLVYKEEKREHKQREQRIQTKACDHPDDRRQYKKRVCNCQKHPRTGHMV